MSPERSFALVRHGQTDYNAARRLNGDPSVPSRSTRPGLAQVAALRPRVAAPADRPRRAARGSRAPARRWAILLAGRDVPRVICPDLDDVRLGEFEGAPVEAYRAWRDEYGPVARPPGAARAASTP